MRHVSFLPLLLLPALAAGQTLTSTAPPITSTPAEWKSYDVLVEFRKLPRTYSCDELWYKVRDVLLKLGARAYMTITPYDCGSSRGGEARSPRVEVKFQLPEPLQGPATRYAQTSVRQQAVQLAPGSPGSLKSDDCELMRQLQETLLAGLPLHVATAAFSCTSGGGSFALTVDARLPVRASATSGS